ncbi:preprotein translocase subunit SecE [Alicyclobacillaceae bacterium I2511]|nr:preprotein translocase subunit SecE [Alicyclobacillaceae bacterium I2511]
MAKPNQTITDIRPRRTGPVKFFAETIRELKRVHWPGRREVINYTTAALLVCLFMGLLVWGFDVGIAKLLSLVGLI